MIKLENTETMGWEHAIRGMRNPMNSWARSDTSYCTVDSKGACRNPKEYLLCEDCQIRDVTIGPNDLDLMKRLAKGGPVHAKYRRMITVYVDITAPLYWWKEFDTYKIGTVANSCSTMHKIAAKEFTLEDFSCEHLFDEDSLPPYEERVDIEHCEPLAAIDVNGQWCYYTPKTFVRMTCNVLNHFRDLYLKTKDKKYWWQMIQLLPSSYNQRRTVMLNYEVLAGIYPMRKDHKLDEWREFCRWIEGLPYDELITGKEE